MKERPDDMGRNISIINKYFKVFLKARLRGTDLSPTEFMIILSLYGSEGLSQEGIIELLGYDKAVITRRIKRLEQFGYLRRIKSKEDLRAFNLFLTEKGHLLKPMIINTLMQWYEAITNDIPEEMINLLIINIDKMAANATAFAAKVKKEGK